MPYACGKADLGLPQLPSQLLVERQTSFEAAMAGPALNKPVLDFK